MRKKERMQGICLCILCFGLGALISCLLPPAALVWLLLLLLIAGVGLCCFHR